MLTSVLLIRKYSTSVPWQGRTWCHMSSATLPPACTWPWPQLRTLSACQWPGWWYSCAPMVCTTIIFTRHYISQIASNILYTKYCNLRQKFSSQFPSSLHILWAKIPSNCNNKCQIVTCCCLKSTITCHITNRLRSRLLTRGIPTCACSHCGHQTGPDTGWQRMWWPPPEWQGERL